MYCWELRLVYARLFFFLWFDLTTTHDWFWLGIFDGAHGGSNKTPWPSTGKNTWLIRTTLFSHRIYRILLDSLDNANTCRDAVSVVKQVSTFAVWNHKRHYVRLTNQQGSIKKVFAVKEVQQKTTTSKWFPHEQMGLQKMQTLIENYVHMISSSAKKNETNAILLFDCWTQDRNIEYEQDIYYCILEKYCGGLWKLLQIVNSIRWLGEVK